MLAFKGCFDLQNIHSNVASKFLEDFSFLGRFSINTMCVILNKSFKNYINKRKKNEISQTPQNAYEKIKFITLIFQHHFSPTSVACVVTPTETSLQSDEVLNVETCLTKPFFPTMPLIFRRRYLSCYRNHFLFILLDILCTI